MFLHFFEKGMHRNDGRGRVKYLKRIDAAINDMGTGNPIN